MERTRKIVPMLFSTSMVQANMDGRKTKTRREIKTPKGYCGFYVCRNSDNIITEIIAHDEHEQTEREDGSRKYIKPKCEEGDIIWVRETFIQINIDDEFKGRSKGFAYKASFDEATRIIYWNFSTNLKAFKSTMEDLM